MSPPLQPGALLQPFWENSGFFLDPALPPAFSQRSLTLRKALYLPALTAWRHNPIVRAFCERLKAHGKNGKLIAGAALRKLVHIAFAVLRSGKPFDPNFALA